MYHPNNQNILLWNPTQQLTSIFVFLLFCLPRGLLNAGGFTVSGTPWNNVVKINLHISLLSLAACHRLCVIWSLSFIRWKEFNIVFPESFTKSRCNIKPGEILQTTVFSPRLVLKSIKQSWSEVAPVTRPSHAVLTPSTWQKKTFGETIFKLYGIWFILVLGWFCFCTFNSQHWVGFECRRLKGERPTAMAWESNY